MVPAGPAGARAARRAGPPARAGAGRRARPRTRPPRSTVYHLLSELTAAGLAVHLPEERRYGLGPAALELGTAFLRQEPLARLARPVLARLVDRVGQSAHLAVLHGREVLYVVEERAPGRPLPRHRRGCAAPGAPDGERTGDARRAAHARRCARSSPIPTPSSTATAPARDRCRRCAGCWSRCAGPAGRPRTAR